MKKGKLHLKISRSFLPNYLFCNSWINLLNLIINVHFECINFATSFIKPVLFVINQFRLLYKKNMSYHFFQQAPINFSCSLRRLKNSAMTIEVVRLLYLEGLFTPGVLMRWLTLIQVFLPLLDYGKDWFTTPLLLGIVFRTILTIAMHRLMNWTIKCLYNLFINLII